LIGVCTFNLVKEGMLPMFLDVSLWTLNDQTHICTVGRKYTPGSRECEHGTKFHRTPCTHHPSNFSQKGVKIRSLGLLATESQREE